MPTRQTAACGRCLAPMPKELPGASSEREPTFFAGCSCSQDLTTQRVRIEAYHGLYWQSCWQSDGVTCVHAGQTTRSPLTRAFQSMTRRSLHPWRSQVGHWCCCMVRTCTSAMRTHQSTAGMPTACMSLKETPITSTLPIIGARSAIPSLRTSSDILVCEKIALEKC